MNLLLNLFTAFFKIGLFSIGGGYAVIPNIQEQVVTARGWISQKIFTDIITISQLTPGPLAVNTSTFVGVRTAGRCPGYPGLRHFRHLPVSHPVLPVRPV